MLKLTCKSFLELSTLELYNILAARQEVFAVEQQIVYQDCDGRDLHGLHLYGTNTDNKLIAYARLLPKGIRYDDYCSIGRVLVLKEERMNNYGKQLMREAIAQCQKHYDAPLKISAQQYLENYYSNLGFTTVTEPYIEDAIWHVGMIYQA